MTANRHCRTWIWLAVAAMAAVSLAPAKSGASAAKAIPNPVLAFLSGHSISSDQSAARIPGVRVHAASRQFGRAPQSGGSGLWLALVPVLFIGLIAPVSLAPSLAARRPWRGPALQPLFERPPPARFPLPAL